MDGGGGVPNEEQATTTETAPPRSANAARRASASRCQWRGSTSTNTGCSPFHTNAWAAAAKVNDGTMASVPDGRRRRNTETAAMRPAVALATGSDAQPVRSWRRAARSSKQGPPLEYQWHSRERAK